MLESILAGIASHSVLGALLVVLGWRYHVLSQELSAVQSARVKDAQQVAETHLAIQEQQRWVIGELTEAVKRLRPPADVAEEEHRRDGPPTRPTRRTS